jgi:hemerythrin-like metal-binding protein
MIELELASARHQIFVFQLELLVEQIEAGECDTTTVGDERACALGAWLHGAGMAYAHLPDHALLVREHGRFHQVAAQMVQLFDAGDIDGAREILSGPFTETSRVVSMAIASLKQTARNERERLAASGDTATGPPWAIDAEMLTGIAMIDGQHRDITEIIIRLLIHPHQYLELPVMADTLRELGDLIALHFESEELFMRHAGLPAPELATHQREHADLLGRYRHLALDPGLHDAEGPCNVCLAVEQWMTDHMRLHDVALKAYAHIPYP